MGDTDTQRPAQTARPRAGPAAGTGPTVPAATSRVPPAAIAAAKRVERIGEATLLLGDCLDLLPFVGPVGAIVTDPPYGIGITRSNRLAVSRGMGGGTWDDAPADLSWLVPMGIPAIVWGGNYFDLPPTRAPLVWDKNNAGRDFADFELAWTNLDMVARRIVFRPMNMDGGKEHPAQKPIEVMRWCISMLPENVGIILDPFAGSGSTGVAAVKLGHSFIGIEIDEGYFDIACRRIEAAYKQPDFFISRPAPAVQEPLFPPTPREAAE